MATESRARHVRGPSLPPNGSAWLGGEDGEGIRWGWEAAEVCLGLQAPRNQLQKMGVAVGVGPGPTGPSAGAVLGVGCHDLEGRKATEREQTPPDVLRALGEGHPRIALLTMGG